MSDHDHDREALVEAVRVELSRGTYQMPGDGRPYETKARALVAVLVEASDPEGTAREALLRLAFVREMLSSASVDEETGELQEDAGGLLSALDYALRGDPGCVDSEEWASERE